MGQEAIRNVSIVTTCSGVLALAIWTLPEFPSPSDYFAHISFEAIRASILIGNIQVAKQSRGWGKPFLVFFGSLLLTLLIAIQISSEFDVYTNIEYLKLPEFWAKQMGNIAVLMAEVTLMFQLGSDSEGYAALSKNKDELEICISDLADHFEIDHSLISEWVDVAKIIQKRSKCEREDLLSAKKEIDIMRKQISSTKRDFEMMKDGLNIASQRSHKFKVDLESLNESFESTKVDLAKTEDMLKVAANQLTRAKEDLSLVKNELSSVKKENSGLIKVLKLNFTIINRKKISINGIAPILCAKCLAINEVPSNRSSSVNCINCGELATKNK